jgi:large repetitive protein
LPSCDTMKKLILILFGAVLSTAAFAQESNCGNGIDDDGDGFIDCFDSNCAANSACDGFYFGNDYVCQAPPTEFPKFSMKLKWGSNNATTNHLNRASVGDLNRDGIPEVVVTEIEGDFIYILNGKTGATIRSVRVSGIQREIVIGNLDNDACGDIFIYTSNSGFFIRRYDCNLNLIWTSVALSAEPMQFGLADFDNDGKVELYSRDEILDAHTGVRIVRGTASNDRDGGPLAVDILNNDNKLELSWHSCCERR